MFRVLASLLLVGSLSPLGQTAARDPLPQLLTVSSPPPLSSLAVSSSFSASGAYVLDLLSGKEIFAYAPDVLRPMGSLAKLMTAIVIVEHHALDEVIVIPQSILEIDGNIVGLRPGERYTLADLLAALLIASANDAAYTLALYHSGTIVGFVEEMNTRARVLGLSKTRFQNPIGFDSVAQGSTPRELAWMALYVWKNPYLRSLVGMREYILRERGAERQMVLTNTNQLLSSHSSSFFGMKTGTTKLAGECLISLVSVAGRPYIFVVLKSTDRYRDALELLASLSQEHV